MPFWSEGNSLKSAARREAEAALPPGWTLGTSDRETYSLPRGDLVTWAASAAGAEGGVLVMAVRADENAAWHALARRLRGHLRDSDGWAPTLADVHGDRTAASFRVYGEEDAEVIAAHDRLLRALPPEWDLYDNDRERFSVGDRQVSIWAVTAAGPNGEAATALALGEANAFRQLERRLRGELTESREWSAPVSSSTW